LGGLAKAIFGGRNTPPVIELPPENQPPPIIEVPPEEGGPLSPPQQLPEPLRNPEYFQRLPRYMQRWLIQNPPAMDPERTTNMGEVINNYRRQPGVPRRIDVPGETGEPVQGGTVAVAQTDIPTLADRNFGGASPEALPPGMRGRPGTSGGT